jgi:hypothetical protein
MKRAPTEAAIYAAELRVAEAKRNARESWARARVAFRETLKRPSTWALGAGAIAFVGVWLASGRFRRRAPVSTETAEVAATVSVAGLVVAFIVRYLMQHWPSILRRVWAARQKRRAGVRSY